MPFNFGASPIVSSADYEMYSGKNPDTMQAAEKGRVEFVMQAAQQMIQNYCGIDFVSGTYEEVWDGQDSDTIIPRMYPIISVQSIVVAGDGNWSNGSVLQATDYNVGPMKNIIFLRAVRVPTGRQLLRLQYTAGFANIPHIVRLATMMQFDFIEQAKTNMGYKTTARMHETQTKDNSVAENGIPAEVKAMLADYVRIDAPLSLMFARVS